MTSGELAQQTVKHALIVQQVELLDEAFPVRHARSATSRVVDSCSVKNALLGRLTQLIAVVAFHVPSVAILEALQPSLSDPLAHRTAHYVQMAPLLGAMVRAARRAPSQARSR